VVLGIVVLALVIIGSVRLASGGGSSGGGGAGSTTVNGYYQGGLAGHRDASGFCVPNGAKGPEQTAPAGGGQQANDLTWRCFISQPQGGAMLVETYNSSNTAQPVTSITITESDGTVVSFAVSGSAPPRHVWILNGANVQLGGAAPGATTCQVTGWQG
jgi:hypothetical protein